MAELKKFKTNIPIEVSLSFRLAKHGFKFLRTDDLGVLDGICDECHHPIRYENRFLDRTDNIEYIFGSNCMFKIYILSHWKEQIKEDQLENKDLQRAGKWLWIISRDKYSEKIDKIPEPKDFNFDFKKLADELKRIVMSTRTKISKEIKVEKEKKEIKKVLVDEKQKVVYWLDSNNIDWKSCNDWERDFIASIYSKNVRNGYSLTEKQTYTLNKIKTKRNKNSTEIKNESTKVEGNETIDFLNELATKSRFMNNWEVEFIDSVLKQALYNNLSSNQWDKINQIVAKIKEEEDKILFVNKKVDEWILEKNTGTIFEVKGIITEVEKETGKAILCSVLNPKTKETFSSIWIPKSTVN